MEVQVQELEKRATAAEAQIESLKAQLQKAPKAAAAAAAAGPAIPAAQVEERLRELMQLLLSDREDCETIRAQRDELKEENARLRQQVAKGEYRIQHLLKTINEIEQKQQS